MKGMVQNAEKCLSNGGRPPLGYRINKETHKYEIKPMEAETVKVIFKMTVQGIK